MFVDSHCHLNFEEYAHDGIDAVIQRAQVAGVSKFLTICTKIEESNDLLKIAENHSDIFCTIGIHPHEAEDTLGRLDQSALLTWLIEGSKHPKVLGFGETGLDYYYNHSPKEKQQMCFRKHLEAAVETGLPLSIHTRDAEHDTIEMLREFPEARGVIHCFTGSEWLRDQALALGFYISVSGIITFNKSQNLRDCVKEIPLDRLLVETDAPFLAPVPFRGKKNEPGFISHTAEELAKLIGVSVDDIASKTTDNFFSLFSKANGL